MIYIRKDKCVTSVMIVQWWLRILALSADIGSARSRRCPDTHPRSVADHRLLTCRRNIATTPWFGHSYWAFWLHKVVSHHFPSHTLLATATTSKDGGSRWWYHLPGHLRHIITASLWTHTMVMTTAVGIYCHVTHSLPPLCQNHSRSSSMGVLMIQRELASINFRIAFGNQHSAPAINTWPFWDRLEAVQVIATCSTHHFACVL